MYDVIPVTRPPRLELSDPPRLPPTLVRLAGAEHRRLLAQPGGYDRDVLVCLGYSEEAAQFYPAPYSLSRAIHAEGSYRWGLGMVVVKLLLDDGRDLRLWQRRSSQVHLPDLWTWSATGAVDPGEEFEQAVVRELEEEVGVAAADLRELRPAAILAGPQTGLSLLFRASVRKDVALMPHPDEVAELRWAREPPAPQTPTTAGCWPRLRALGLG